MEQLGLATASTPRSSSATATPRPSSSAVRKVAAGEAQMLMKGLVSTSAFLHGVLNKEWGLRQRPLLSHVALFEAHRRRTAWCSSPTSR